MELNEKITWDVGPNEVLKIPDAKELTFLKNALVLKQNKVNWNK